MQVFIFFIFIPDKLVDIIHKSIVKILVVRSTIVVYFTIKVVETYWEHLVLFI